MRAGDSDPRVPRCWHRSKTKRSSDFGNPASLALGREAIPVGRKAEGNG